VISLTDFFSVDSRRLNDVIQLPAIRRVSDRTVHQHTAPRECNSWNCCIKKRQIFLRPTCGLQTAQISVLWITRSGLSCSIVSTTDKSIVWMNWNGGSSMSGEVLNSRFLARLLTAGEEDIERVSMLKENSPCRSAVSVRLSVHPSHSCIVSKRIIISANVLPSGSRTFSVPNFMAIFQRAARAPPNGGYRYHHTGGVWKKSLFSIAIFLLLNTEHMKRLFVACCQRCDRQVS